MALTFITIKLISPKDPKKTFSRKFLVDSGAVYSVVDTDILEDLGIKGTRTRKFTLANGQTIEKSVGEVIFEYRGEKITSPVVFGNKGIFLLGAVTLETFGLILDPINRKLRQLPMLI
jgi:clan AA aspartic protease